MHFGVADTAAASELSAWLGGKHHLPIPPLVFAKHLDHTVADEAFLVGLMQDLALPVLHQCGAEAYKCLTSSELQLVEKQQFGMDHGQAAANLGLAMGLPQRLCDLLERHHAALTGVLNRQRLIEYGKQELEKLIANRAASP